MSTTANPAQTAGVFPAPDDTIAEIRAKKRIPRATYRLQFGNSLTLADARRLVPYLDKLGVSDIYASPLLRPSDGSPHCYDVCDHNSLNPAVGTEEDLAALSRELRQRDMGLILDYVPNHMGINPANNAWWFDVLENGPSSPYASFFDIDWHPMKVEADLENRVLLPVLGGPYGRVLENGEIRLEFSDGAFRLAYYEHRFPIAPDSYAEILRRGLDRLATDASVDEARLHELQSIITALGHLPDRTETEPDRVAERQREKEIAKRRIAELCAASPEVRAAIDDTVIEYNGQAGDPRSFDLLDALLDLQSYRLAYWRVATEEINYRRFFDVNDLAAIRMERPEVFEHAHRLVLQLLAEGTIHGLRIDHPDGLWDPAGYLRELQRQHFLALARRIGVERVGCDATDAALDQWVRDLDVAFGRVLIESPRDERARPLYVVVEKILSHGERLPDDWPVDGTTGYDFANVLNGIFVDPSSRKAFDDLYAGFIRSRPRFADLVNSSKKMIMLISLASEINELAYELKRIAQRNRWYRDFTLNSLTFAIREVIATLPVYRTYLVGPDHAVSARDRNVIDVAIGEAKRRNPRTASAVFDFIRDVLLLNFPSNLAEDERAEWASFVMHFQQTTGPVTAKGVEDTAFYLYNRLVSLNEVGGDPSEFGVSPTQFHRQNAERFASWPHSLVGTSTHDSKRGEDVRARVDVLSEVPRLWKSALGRWARANRPKKTLVDGELAPSRNDEYLLYQTLVGAWPLGDPDDAEWDDFRRRIEAYLLKALREAKARTSWINPNVEYENAAIRFVRAVLDRRASERFLADFQPVQELTAWHGAIISLAQTLIKVTAPGVPDIYQGTERWSFSLVDPDNRRPVDFSTTQRMLDDLLGDPRLGATTRAHLARELLDHWQDGRVKLYVLERSLSCRRARPNLFSTGEYVALEAHGTQRDHVFAFGRQLGDHRTVVVVPRLTTRLTGAKCAWPLGPEIWHDTALRLPASLAGDAYENVFTGELLCPTTDDGAVTLTLSKVFATFPVALLQSVSTDRRSRERVTANATSSARNASDGAPRSGSTPVRRHSTKYAISDA